MALKVTKFFKLSNKIGIFYVEYSTIKTKNSEIVISNAEEEFSLPINQITTILIGPGTSITHQSIVNISKSGLNIVWTQHNSNGIYASAICSRKANNIEKHAILFANHKLDIAKKFYIKRFKEDIKDIENVNQLLGKEGYRVREQYKELSKQFGIKWEERETSLNWDENSLINKSISFANHCLYGLCHAAIIALGYSPSLGFLHEGNQLSFVFDVADLYKAEIALPPISKAVAEDKIKDIHLQKAVSEIFQSECFDKITEIIVNDIEGMMNDSDSVKKV